MLFVKIGDHEYMPFLREDSIKLKDPLSNTILLSGETPTELYIRQVSSTVDQIGQTWFPCDYFRLRSLLESQYQEVTALQAALTPEIALA